MRREHVFVRYDDAHELASAVAPFFSDGASLGRQLRYVGWSDRDEAEPMRSALARDLPVEVGTFDSHFTRAVPPEPPALAEYWADATRAAIAAGFTGLHAVANTTPWASSPTRREVLVRSDHVVDRYVIDHPFGLVCACAATELTDDASAELTTVHRETEGAAPSPFRIVASRDADVAIAGEVDAFSASLLSRLLDVLEPRPRGELLVVDGRDLAFFDHRMLFELERYAEASGLAGVVFRTAGKQRRLVELVRLDRVRVEIAT